LNEHLINGREQTRSALFVSIGLFAAMLLFSLTGLFVGVKGFSLSQIGEIWTTDFNNLLAYKLWYVRLPRVLLAILIGAALATAGCLLQGITRNPLSDPEVLGINQGASFVIVLTLTVFNLKDVSGAILIAAFIGAAIGGSIVYVLSQLTGYSIMRLILAGVAVSMFMGSLTTGFIILFDERLSEILYWMAGKLSGSNWQDIRLALISIVPALIGSYFFANTFNIFSLGEEMAKGLGQNVVLVRRSAFFLVIILVGGSVAVAGPIGFIGLMAPHIVRAWIGTNYRIVFPLSALLGATLLLIADQIGQWLFYPTETPAGIVTAFIGTPFFLYLMYRRKVRS